MTGEPRARCVGAILAGGSASRYGGVAKGLERVGGRRLIDRVADALRAAADELLVVGDRADAATWLPDARVVGDARPGRGSLVGVHAALTHARGAAALVVAWDMPFVTRALLAELRALGERAGGAAVPWTDEGPEPLCAYYPPDTLVVAERQLDAGALRMGDLVASLPRVARLEGEALRAHGDPAWLFANVNAPAELREAELRESGRLAPPDAAGDDHG